MNAAQADAPAPPAVSLSAAPGKPLRSRLLEFLQEDDGSLSATRLAFLLWAVGVLVVWMVVSIRCEALQSVSGDVTTILGILMTGKVVQKFGEKPPGPQP